MLYCINVYLDICITIPYLNLSYLSNLSIFIEIKIAKNNYIYSVTFYHLTEVFIIKVYNDNIFEIHTKYIQ